MLSQMYVDLEVIVVDDASTDGTPRAVREIDDPRVRLVRNQSNLGACAARNRGIAEAKGGYVALQDSDDEWLPNKLQVQLDLLDRTGADVCSCHIRRHYSDGTYERLPKWEQELPGRKTLVRAPGLSTQTLLARREVFESVPFQEGLGRLQDWEWVIRASERYDFCVCPEELVEVWVGSDSISQRGLRSKLDALHHIYELHEAELPACSELEAGLLDQLAFCKTALGENASREYLRCFGLTHSPKALAKAVLSGSGLLRSWASSKTKVAV